jgi:hypothetical protein
VEALEPAGLDDALEERPRAFVLRLTENLTGRPFFADDGVDGKPHWREGNGIKWVVLRDPEGNEFCVGSIPDAVQGQVSPRT